MPPIPGPELPFHHPNPKTKKIKIKFAANECYKALKMFLCLFLQRFRRNCLFVEIRKLGTGGAAHLDLQSMVRLM